MKYTVMHEVLYQVYATSTNRKMKEKMASKERRKMWKKIKKEYKEIVARAPFIGKKNVLNGAYMMAAYFIALNRSNQFTAEENYQFFANGLKENEMFRKFCGTAQQYLDESRMPKRREWDEETHKRKYPNDWVVTVLEKTDEYELGYDYEECGVCKLCTQENAFELAHYLCRMDFIQADIMGMKLVRTKTIADGGDICDFRYSRMK